MFSSPTTSMRRKNTRDTTRKNQLRIRYATGGLHLKAGRAMLSGMAGWTLDVLRDRLGGRRTAEAEARDRPATAQPEPPDQWRFASGSDPTRGAAVAVVLRFEAEPAVLLMKRAERDGDP